MKYMESFEVDKYEKLIPDTIKPREWKHFIDDNLIVYEHREEVFQEFMDRLNALDPCIRFTCERS